MVWAAAYALTMPLVLATIVLWDPLVRVFGGPNAPAWLQATGGFLSVAVASYVAYNEHQRRRDAEAKSAYEKGLMRRGVLADLLRKCEAAVRTGEHLLGTGEVRLGFYTAWKGDLRLMAAEIEGRADRVDDLELVNHMHQVRRLFQPPVNDLDDPTSDELETLGVAWRMRIELIRAVGNHLRLLEA